MSYKKPYENDCPEYLRDFITYYSVIKGRSDNTVNSYYEDIKLFIRFLKKRTDNNLEFSEITVSDFPEESIKKVNLSDVLEFLHFLSSERRNNAKARLRRAVALRRFFKYLTDNKMWWEKSPLYNLEMPAIPKTLPKHLSESQAERLLDSTEKRAYNKEYPKQTKTHKKCEHFTGIRDFCILTLFLNCGIRLSELTSINVNDIKKSDDDGGEYILTVYGKGSKERILYFNPSCISAYEKYIKARCEFIKDSKIAQKDPALFLSTRRKRITPRRVEQITDEALKEANIPQDGISPHKLRHTAATLMYQNGADVRILKEVLGHENLNTTQIYTHVVSEQIKSAMHLNPLGNNENGKTSEQEYYSSSEETENS